MYSFTIAYSKPPLMRSVLFILAIILCLLLCSCSSINKKTPAEAVSGNWLIIFPDHRLRTVQEREVYGKHQDSIVSLYGLKLISLKPDGTFAETDSIRQHQGKWVFTKDSVLRLQEGGKGFNPFTASFKSFDNDTLQLIQYLPLESEKIKLVWYLKKIDGDTEGAKLFDAADNNWREKPVALEPAAVMRKRLAEMLAYYATYFTIISKEASYFVPVRVPLPFNYYQHGIGMNSALSPAFKALFYNDADAGKAYGILKGALRGTDVTSTGDNYVIEYGLFLKKMGEVLEK